MPDFAVRNRSLIIVLTGLVLAFVFYYLFVWHVPGISAPLFVLLLAASLTGLAYLFDHKLSRDVSILLLLALFFSGMLAVRASPLLVLLNIGATLLLLVLVTEVSVRGSMQRFFLWDYVLLARIPFAYFFSLVETITSVRFAGTADDTSRQVIRGLLVALPVVALFTLLFAQADPTFHRFLGFFEDLYIKEDYLVIVLAFAALCGALAFSFSVPRESKVPGFLVGRSIGRIETAILLGSVNALFLAFILLQASYLFGGMANITEGGFTFAEYARRGFFELMAIAGFTWLILVIAEKLVVRESGRHSRVFRFLSAALVLQTFVLMVFAFNRLSLYEAAFGFTILRLYSHAFILLLAAVFLILVYKIFIDGREDRFLLRTLGAIAVFLVGMNLLNPDLFIANKNIERFSATGKMDYAYLTRLSSDAAPALFAAFKAGDAVERAPLGKALYERSLREPLSWQSWNLARTKAAELLKTHQDALSAYKE